MFTPDIAEYILVFLLIALVWDIFFEWYIPTILGILYFSAYLTNKVMEHTTLLDGPWVYLFSIFSFFLMLAGYLYLWKGMKIFLDKTFLRKQNALAADAAEKAVGSSGIIRIIDGDYFIKYNSDLYAIDKNNFNPSDFSDGQSVTIAALKDGIVSVNK